MPDRPADIVDELRAAGVVPGARVAVAVGAGGGLGVASTGLITSAGGDQQSAAAAVSAIERELRPRWVVWNPATTATLLRWGAPLATCWDLSTVHRLAAGGWRAEPSRIWALAHGLSIDTLPDDGPVNLFNQADRDAGDPDEPVRPDGHLRPDWGIDGWSATPQQLGRWASAALGVAELQTAALASDRAHPVHALVARSESAAELLCNELAAAGLPMDGATAESIIEGYAGPRTHTFAEAEAERARRDTEVLRHVPGVTVDLRSPGQVKALLRRVGIEVPDTRAWRLREHRDTHPVVSALLAWRKAERFETTFGYAWLDEHLGADGRLRGSWMSCDGAAGRMTASAGLHNMPADLRPAVRAEPGHLFVRSDLGQIEPRVLAAVSGDPALQRATAADDLYAPVAEALSVDRATAKVAVLGAMYGQTTGHGAQALKGLRSAYPVAMAYLDHADAEGQAGRNISTHGGRTVRLSAAVDVDRSEGEGWAVASGRGRFARNAMVQGAAAELFKLWAVTVRARVAAHGAQIVLCLHDELVVHTPAAVAAEVAELVDRSLQEAAHRWAPAAGTRFLTDTSVVERWSDAKE